MRKAFSTRSVSALYLFGQHVDTRYKVMAVLLALVAGCSMAVVATADTLELINGRSLEGRAVVRDNGDVELHSSMGMIVIPATKVAKVTRAKTIEDRVLDELMGLTNVSADDLFELGEEARRGGASTLAKELFSEAVRLNPEHEASRSALGFYRTDEGWRTGPPPTEAPDVSPAARFDNIEQAERVALLRALRAQATAARVAEQQRQVFLATQTALANSAVAQPVAYRDGHLVQRLLPFVPVVSYAPPSSEQVSHSRGTRRATNQGPGRATPPQAPRQTRKNTIVRSPRP